VFFQCDWFDPINDTRVDDFGMVEVKHESLYSGANLLLAHQAEQVYYLSYSHPRLKNWLCSYLTQYFVGLIYGGVEEGPRTRATRPEGSPLQHRHCVYYGRRYPTWTVSEYINYYLKLSIVSS
jgi:hypothetical protein